MRRKASYDQWFWSAYDKTSLEPGLLEAVGHLSFLWNDIEEALDRAFMWTCECPTYLQVEIRSRISGLDAKIEITKAAINRNERIPHRLGEKLLITAGAFLGYKQCRDAVIHARASEVANGVARTFERQGSVYEVLLTRKAIEALNAHLELYAKEMASLAGLLCSFTANGQVFAASIKKSAEENPDVEMYQIAAQADQRYLSTLEDCQHKRKALPPLPTLVRPSKGKGEKKYRK